MSQIFSEARHPLPSVEKCQRTLTLNGPFGKRELARLADSLVPVIVQIDHPRKQLFYIHRSALFAPVSFLSPLSPSFSTNRLDLIALYNSEHYFRGLGTPSQVYRWQLGR